MDSLKRRVVIDGSRANRAENMLYRGNGMVSANNSSRLLLDYKQEHPDAYREILEHLFGSDGLAISHLKIEMGSDINSSSGTEPAVKRTPDEPADVTRGAGYQLAADAKKINPFLTLDMLWWSEPRWITDAEDVYAARYQWYKETLDAAYLTYGLKFDYVSAVQNERAHDKAWIKYLSAHLKSETAAPYDYSAIKIVVGDEVCTWGIAEEMLSDKELRDAVDAVGSHYTSFSTDSAKRLALEYGKELWFSEACSPMEYSQGTFRYDGSGSGFSDTNGMLDIAARFISMYPCGLMTLCEYQPAVAAYYDGVTYSQKQFILANEPWSGYYLPDCGFFMGLHFSRYFRRGWSFIDGACFGDGRVGGDGHAIVDAVYTYMTAADPVTGDYSTAIVNTTGEPIVYEFNVKGLAKASAPVYLRETKGPEGGSYDENYFRPAGTVTPAPEGDAFTFTVTVKPYSLVTLSTLKLDEKSYKTGRVSRLLPLPYSDDFDYPEEYLASRGGAPRFTTDEGGAFEVISGPGGRHLMQKITPELKAREWGWTPEPVTNFGDDRWFDYSVETRIKFAPSDAPDKNYAGAGLRYILGDSGMSGYLLLLCESGRWELKRNGTVLKSGSARIPAGGWIALRTEAKGGSVRAQIDGVTVCEYTSAPGEPVMPAGRAALYSSYNKNLFDFVKAEPAAEKYSVTRYDCTDSCVSYCGQWEHICMGSFRYYKRTLAKGHRGSSFTLSFTGTGFAVLGENEQGGELSVTVDGLEAEKRYTFLPSGSREITYRLSGLPEGGHTAVITVLSDSFAVDAFEIM